MMLLLFSLPSAVLTCSKDDPSAVLSPEPSDFRVFDLVGQPETREDRFVLHLLRRVSRYAS